MTQDDLQTASGVHHSTISHIENGDRFPSWANAVKLGAALNIDPAELADVASPSLLYLVSAIADKMGIQPHLSEPGDTAEPAEGDLDGAIDDEVAKAKRARTDNGRSSGQPRPHRGKR